MTTTASVLRIDLQNQIDYQGDIYDPSVFATNPGVTSPTTPRNFFVATQIADIVSVNGNPAKGIYVGRTRVIAATPNPSPGDAIADVTRVAMREHMFEILNTEGTEVGTIMSTGFSGGDAPGVSSIERGNWAIVGGTGAYLGARGQVAGTGRGGRGASMTEDPAQRRNNRGNDNAFILHIIPMHPPQIMTSAFGPLVFDNNFTPVTALTPARQSNQPFSLFATGLGPTHPDVDLAQPFPLSPPSEVNSPLTVDVNGNPAEILSAVGLPGAVNAYQVRFRMPAAAGAGLVPIRLSVAWIAGPPVSIWVA
jgi:hypothetical protein